MINNELIKGVMLDKDSIRRTLARISHEIVEKNEELENIALIGIKTRGVYIAQRIHDFIFSYENVSVVNGVLDISDYRDDLSNDILPSVPEFDFGVAGKDIILVDDVLFTGRTVRAAIEAIMRVGRPRSIQLAVLIDRGHRELPIRADYVGKNIPTSRSEEIRVLLEEIDAKDDVLLLKTNL